jgi:hypothetical protein
MIWQTKSISIWIIFCILWLFGVGICFAQSNPSDSALVDCASLVTSDQNSEAFGCFGRAIESDPKSALNWAGQGEDEG